MIMAETVTAIPIDVPERRYAGSQLEMILNELKSATGDKRLIAQAQLVILVDSDMWVLDAPRTEAERLTAREEHRLATIEVTQVQVARALHLLGPDADQLQRVINPTIDDLSI
jgi:hypothetical protein